MHIHGSACRLACARFQRATAPICRVHVSLGDEARRLCAFLQREYNTGDVHVGLQCRRGRAWREAWRGARRLTRRAGAGRAMQYNWRCAIDAGGGAQQARHRSPYYVRSALCFSVLVLVSFVGTATSRVRCFASLCSLLVLRTVGRLRLLLAQSGSKVRSGPHF